jgi:hypothetical protein
VVRQRLGVAALSALLAQLACVELGPPSEPRVPDLNPDLALPAPVYRLVTPGDVETWMAPGGRTVTFDRKKRKLTRNDGGQGAVRKVPKRWQEWGPLRLCLGAPLADPPAEDPGAFRKLIWEESPYWVLEYSGLNLCNATGVARLQADGQQVDVSDLWIDGLRWHDGGLERAYELGMGHIQASAVEWWLTGTDVSREVLLRTLRDDPDPASEQALRNILEVAGPGERDLVLSALAHRPVAGPRTARGEKPK